MGKISQLPVRKLLEAKVLGFLSLGFLLSVGAYGDSAWAVNQQNGEVIYVLGSDPLQPGEPATDKGQDALSRIEEIARHRWPPTAFGFGDNAAPLGTGYMVVMSGRNSKGFYHPWWGFGTTVREATAAAQKMYHPDSTTFNIDVRVRATYLSH